MNNPTEGGRYRRWIAVALFVVMGLVVVVGVAAEWLGPLRALAGWETASMALFTGIATLAAYTFPIHIGYHTKVTMTTVPLFLTAALLPVPLAVLVAAAATLLGELVVRADRGNLPVDVVITGGRWALIVLAASAIAGLPATNPLARTARLAAAALVMFLGDIVSTTLHVAQFSGESPRIVSRQLLREGGQVELVQYILALLGAFAALQHFWSPVLLLLPVAVIYVAFKNAKELQDSTRQFLETLADAVDLRDSYTGGHSRRVGELCAATLSQLGIRGPEADLIVSAARVHDIGKIGTPDGILLKVGKLDAEETKVMQAHAARGAEMLMRYDDFVRGAEFVLHHHESWDGRGYPAGLAGTAIPFGARIIAVADSFDAMTSARPYRGPMSLADATHILRAGRSTQWDPQIVDAFLQFIEPRLLAGAAELPARAQQTKPFPTAGAAH